MSIKCRICENVEGNKLHKAREMMFGLREVFNYIECAQCNCLQIEHVPSDLDRHYPPDYYSLSGGNPAISSPLQRMLKTHYSQYELGNFDPIGWVIGRIYKKSLSIGWVKHARPQLHDKILDVGCGNGGHLSRLSNRGYTNLAGVDPYIEKDVEYGNGVKLYKRSLDEMQGKFKIVVLNHTFEHLPEPESSLRNIARLLEHDGTAVIRIPVSNCYAWKKYGVDWVQLDAPRHLFLHNEQTMRILAAKTGFQIEGVEYDSWAFQFSASDGYAKDIPLVIQNKEPGPSADIKTKYSNLSAKLNDEKLGDQAAFYLKLAHPEHPNVSSKHL